MEVGPEDLKVALTVVDPEGRLEDLMEADPEGRLVGLMVGHLEGERFLRLYREFLLQARAPRLEFLPLLLGPLPGSLLVLGLLLLAKPALLRELFQELPYLLSRQRLRQTYHLLQRFFHLL